MVIGFLLSKKLALKKSIKHWKQVSNVNRIIEADIGPDNCALCAKYYKKDCAGCPVSAVTKDVLCYSTPYNAVIRARREHDLVLFKQEALKMLQFLKDLEVQKN